MIKGKYIMIVIIVLLLSYFNYKVYNIFTTASENDHRTGDNGIAFATIFTGLESTMFFIVLIYNWNKLWNWQFNLNRWICKLKH